MCSCLSQRIDSRIHELQLTDSVDSTVSSNVKERLYITLKVTLPFVILVVKSLLDDSHL